MTIRHIIPTFPSKTIGVLGDFMLDELLVGQATRLSPEAPVPVVQADEGQKQYFLGGAGNVAANVAALGGKVVVFGATGADEPATQIARLLLERQIEPRLLRSPNRLTPRKLRIVAHQHQLLRLDFERPEPLSAFDRQEVLRAVKQGIDGLDALIISDYAKGSAPRELCEDILALYLNTPVLVDPKVGTYFTTATCITPNEREAQRIAGVEDYRVAGDMLLSTVDNVLITRGANGMALFEDSSPRSQFVTPYEIPAAKRPVYDVTGAGDTVIAALALAYVSGATMREAAELANVAAGIAVSKFGTAVVTADELLGAYTHLNPPTALA